MRAILLQAARIVGLVLALAPPLAANAQRSIELVLDASGSMNARLPDGSSRLAAAQAAVARLAASLPDDAVLALRAYGHQSPRERHDCNDTALLVPFGDLAANRAAIVSSSRALAARGYTPISRVLRLAAADLAPRGGERVVILVSDGKETCDTDPCATARELHEADARLVVHAIGFEVDSAARSELACIAAATGGSYSDATGLDGLAQALGEASRLGPAQVPATGREPGNLEIRNADMRGHEVLDASTGEVVGKISSFARTIRVPAGLYNVRFGKGLWRGVEVKPDTPTVLEPAVLAIENAAMHGHRVTDSETSLLLDELSSFRREAPMLPGLYDVSFGGAVWPLVRLDSGTRTTLRPGVLRIEGASMNGHVVRDAAGREVARPSSFQSSQPLPPGDYTVEIGGRRVPVALVEGEIRTLSAR